MKDHTLKSLALIPLALSVLMCSGDEPEGQVGVEGLLTFRYISTDNDPSVQRPIATGATTTMLIDDANAGGLECLEAISASNPSIIEPLIVSRRGNTIIVNGLTEGSSMIELEAIVGEDKTTVTDRINVSVATPDTYLLTHSCPHVGKDQVAYLRGMPARLGYARLAGETRLRGAGACKVETDSARPLEVRCDDNSVTISGDTQSGAVALNVPNQPNIVTLNFIEDQAVIIAQKQQLFTLDEPTRLELELRTLIWPVCNAVTVNVEVLTPMTCSLWPDQTIYSDGLFNHSLTYVPGQALPLSIKGLEEGACTLMVSSPALSTGPWSYTTPVYTTLDD